MFRCAFSTSNTSLNIQTLFHHFLRCLGNCKTASTYRESSSKLTFPQSHKLELMRLLKSILPKPQICFQLYPFFLLCFLLRFRFVSLLLATVLFLKVKEARSILFQEKAHSKKNCNKLIRLSHICCFLSFFWHPLIFILC